MKDKKKDKPKPPCPLCRDKVSYVDYKDYNSLRRFLSPAGKIKASKNTGLCSQHQRGVAIAIKRAREMALLPYKVQVVKVPGEEKFTRSR